MLHNIQKLIAQISVIFLGLLCSSCTNNNKTTQKIYHDAQCELAKNNYPKAAESFLTIANRNPTSKLGKKSASAGIWLLTHQLVNSMLGPQFNTMLALRIITECNILIALDPMFAMRNRIHICKIIAHLMIIRPVQDFNYKALQDLNDIIKQYDKRDQDHVHQLNQSIEDYYKVLNKQPIDFQREIWLLDMHIMQHISEFLNYMQNSNKYICAATKIKNAVLAKSSSLNAIIDLDPIINLYTGSYRMCILSMRSTLAKMQILAELDIDSEYIYHLYTHIVNIYKLSKSKLPKNKIDTEQCEQIIMKAQNIINIYENKQDGHHHEIVNQVLHNAKLE